MKQIFKKGDKKYYKKVVEASDVAAFDGKEVHHVCSTFALARDMEWSSRLFVLDMVEEGEEGIGTMLHIDHKGPALVGQEIEIAATVDTLNGNELICDIEVRVKGRLVATGKTGQKVLRKESIKRIFSASE